jgi:hypothetical protein
VSENSIENIGNDSIVHIDLDGAGSGQSYVSITLFNTTLSFEDLSNANALIGITKTNGFSVNFSNQT